MKFFKRGGFSVRRPVGVWALTVASLCVALTVASLSVDAFPAGGEKSGGGGAASAAALASPAAESATPAGDVVVVLNEAFLNALVGAILSQSSPPKFPLSKTGSKDCPSEIMLMREAKGTRTAVRFRDGRVTAPVAFRGSYYAPLVGCFRFEGWADTVFNLAFDAGRQAFTARIEVREVNLNKMPSLLTGGITGLVQDAIDERVNPVVILRAEQLAARIPLAQDNSLRLRAREVQHEIVGKELRLRVIYEIVRSD